MTAQQFPPERPLPIHPTRSMPRGEFPVHTDLPRPLLTGPAARRRAAARLAEWRRDHAE